MAALLSYQNRVTSGMLSSPNTWSSTLPLTRAATRQLSEYAQLASAGTSADIRVDLGSVGLRVSMAALLGISDTPGGNMDIRITSSSSSATGTDAYDSGVIYLDPSEREALDTPHIMVPMEVSTGRYWRFVLNFPSTVFKVGRVWLGPVFGGTIADAPPITRFRISPVDPTTTSRSPGAQSYARELTRVRSLAFRYDEMEQIYALGEFDNNEIIDIERIGRLIGSGSPCLVCARNDDIHLRHRTLVYGANVGTWEVEHTGGNRYSSTADLVFKGEN